MWFGKTKKAVEFFFSVILSLQIWSSSGINTFSCLCTEQIPQTSQHAWMFHCYDALEITNNLSLVLWGGFCETTETTYPISRSFSTTLLTNVTRTKIFNGPWKCFYDFHFLPSCNTLFPLKQSSAITQSVLSTCCRYSD